MKWELFFGLRIIRNRSRWGAITLTAVLSIAFGITAMLVSLSVITGFEAAYKKAILGFNAHLIVIGEGEIKNMREIEEILSSFRDKGVIAVTPFIFREGLGIVKEGAADIILKGVDPQTMESVYDLHFQSLEPKGVSPKGDSPKGNLASLLSATSKKLPPVFVGKDLLHRFFTGVIPENPVIRLLIPRGEASHRSLSDFAQEFRVVGFFDAGLYEFDSQFILTSFSTINSLFHLSGEVSGFEALLDDPDKAPQLARLIEEKLPPLFQVVSWNELNEALFLAMKMEKTLFLVIMLVVILIASFNVVGVIMMMILNRGQDIAILKALGVPPRQLIRSFSLQGLFLALVGSALGSLLSFIFLYSLQRFSWFKLDPQVYFISHIPVVWPSLLWMILIGVSLMICYGTSQLATRISLREGTFTQTFR